jgi:hypothetical protein
MMKVSPTHKQLLRIVEALRAVRKDEIAYQAALERGDMATCRLMLAASKPKRDAIDHALEMAGFSDDD